ncbi:glycosyltransferase [Mycobacterium avium subsp. hominissuis]|uniref:glycosyltransferase n=1 Tax=Mycobacterium avium TaxID=1764 RepID=UPI002666DD44|nr:glycosyltransferase [Mycobacterium avium]MDO2396113.1 glycosyltransferase [Mycobacterium avium subsp. hominissuis]
MSRVIIIAVGSRGDVAPLTGVGVALQQAGHTVSIAAYTPFADMITECGLGFHELPAELELAADGAEVQPMKGIAAFASPTGMRALGRDILTAIEDVPADIALLSPFAEMAGHPWAESRGIPSIGVRLQPLSATAQHPPAILGSWSAGAAGNRAAAHTATWLVDRAYSRVVADLRRDLGLPPASTRALRKQRTKAHWPILHGYSPLVAPRPPDWRPGLDVTGYWWPARSSTWAPPPELTEFISNGPPPVFIGFGSMMTTPNRAEQLSNLIGQAALQAGVRVLVQAGWTSLHITDDTVMTIGDTPHDWLFPRMAAIAHHCGAGTTAAGLRAGIPTIALPAYGDGPFWAARLTALGVTAATINQRHLNGDRLAAAMRTAVDDAQLRDNAHRLGAQIAAEDGAAHALNAVESLLQHTT